ncbi:probable serine/threonine-protein kinase nek3 [Trichogramma pretiosum]|uniref:probable serine/threonine-protein kinase nek3 n=1 Tax=Trichogramma pretiosum TaxID=7493 RepID=UPI0006C9DD4B|nr:probable serine/threonine-protein kinase nek3 [Trichogramma pretiosum]
MKNLHKSSSHMTMRRVTALPVVVVLLLLAVVLESISAATLQANKPGTFGGYRITPKPCKPSSSSALQAVRPGGKPPICMFNDECTRRRGVVVDSCRDGFLFGACCQLPDNDQKYHENVHQQQQQQQYQQQQEVDHVPELPILLKEDGTPIEQQSTTKTHYNYATASTTDTKHSNVDLDNLDESFSSLLGNGDILDSLQLPTLITHPDPNENYEEQQQHHHQGGQLDPIPTSLNNQIIQIVDPVDQLPALFSQKLQKNNSSSSGGGNNGNADTILIGDKLNSYDPDELFQPAGVENIVVSTDTLNFGPSSSLSTSSSFNNNNGEDDEDEDEEGAYRHSPTTPKTVTVTSPVVTVSTPATKKATLITKLKPATSFASDNKPSTKNRPPSKKGSSPMPGSSKAKPTSPRPPTTASITKVVTPTSQPAATFTTLTTRHGEDFTSSSSSPTEQSDEIDESLKQAGFDNEEIAINHIINSLLLNDTNPKHTTSMTQRPTTTYHWVSSSNYGQPSLMASSVSPPPSVVNITPKPAGLSSTQSGYYQNNYYSSTPSNYYHYNTASSTEPSKASYSYYKPAASSSSSTSAYPTSSSYPSSSSHKYTGRPTTNPPAPTVIVLGPLNTDYTTVPSSSTPTRIGSNNNNNNKVSSSTQRPSLITKNPNLASLTHNISTVISGNKQVLSVSVISVGIKDGTTARPTTTIHGLDDSSSVSSSYYTSGSSSPSVSPSFVTKRPTIYTTVTSWSDKPSFHLRPTTTWSSVNYEPGSPTSSDGDPSLYNAYPSTTSSNCEDETPAVDDVNNFPPVRHPELDGASHNQDKPPTPVEPAELPGLVAPEFVEDAELNNKVDVFVSKIVESLQGNFQNLKDVVYNSKNVTTGGNLVTKRPASSSSSQTTVTKRPTATTRPTTIKGNRRPTPTPKPGSGTQKLTTARPRPQQQTSTVVTRRPTTIATSSTGPTKRPKPLKKLTTLPPPSQDYNFEATTISRPQDLTTLFPEITPNADFRSVCGIRPLMKSGRIVGGKGATFGEWPWQVLVREATWLGLFTKNKCGGVLITDKYVITAAHCQPGFLASLVAVFGEFDISGELESRRSVTRNVRRVIVNRAYDPATFENDLALLELETPIQFDVHIVPICMPDDDTDYTNRMATVTGWGRLKYSGGVPSVLQEVKVPIMENSVCQEMFQTAGHSKLILDSFMCAGYANGQKDSCEGDSGGPLSLQGPDGRWILVGTVSHGIKCAAPYLPGVYMRMTYFKPWLHSITGV